MPHDKRRKPKAGQKADDQVPLLSEVTLHTLPSADAGVPTHAERSLAGRQAPTGSDLALQFRKLLGEGGMGKVYLAYDPILDRYLAVKELSPSLSEHEGHRAAFIQEARTVARLDHPSIVPIHALINGPEGQPAFTMQALKGQSLHEWMRRPEHQVGSQERLSLGIEIMLKVCDALAYAHSRRVLHCDLKPDNIMVGDFGNVHLMDWGLSRPFVHEVADGVCGTPAFMSPEQARNERLEVRSDVFGVGAILYELVTGKVPYGSFLADEVLPKATAGEVVDIAAADPDLNLSPRLCKIVMRAIAPVIADRYPSVMALRQDLHTFLMGGFHLPRSSVKAGSLVIREGDIGTSAYVLLGGRCEVFRKSDPPGTPSRILGPGDIFGELALALGGRRTASVRAIEDCVILTIDRETLESSGAMGGWAAALLRALARRFQELEQRLDMA
jgi:serine/threonine-protein kinase